MRLKTPWIHPWGFSEKDNMSCSIFSLDHVLPAGLCSDLHTQLIPYKEPEAKSPSFKTHYVQLKNTAREYIETNDLNKTKESIKQFVNDKLKTSSAPPSPSFASGW